VHRVPGLGTVVPASVLLLSESHCAVSLSGNTYSMLNYTAPNVGLVSGIEPHPKMSRDGSLRTGRGTVINSMSDLKPAGMLIPKLSLFLLLSIELFSAWIASVINSAADAH
jgi:hypothetical protein